MQLNVPPELESKLALSAERRGLSSETVALEAIERAVAYDDWFLSEIEQGLDQVNRGNVLTNAAVRDRLAARFGDDWTNR